MSLDQDDLIAIALAVALKRKKRSKPLFLPSLMFPRLRVEGQLRFDARHLFTRSNRSLDNEAPPTKVRMSLTFIEPFDERARQPNTPFTRSNITSNAWLSNQARRAVRPCKPGFTSLVASPLVHFMDTRGRAPVDHISWVVVLSTRLGTESSRGARQSCLRLYNPNYVVWCNAGIRFIFPSMKVRVSVNS